MEGVFLIAAQALTGVGLAASAGLRAFLPLFVVGVSGRFDWIPISGTFEWVTTTPALVVFGVAVVTEVLADKVPVVDHALDVAQTFVKPVAGTILAASVLTELSPLHSTVLGLVMGGSTAGVVQVAKAKTRLASTVTTAGVANPAISVGEDAGSLFGTIAALLAPAFVGAILAVGAVCAALAWRRRAVRPLAEGPTAPTGA